MAGAYHQLCDHRKPSDKEGPIVIKQSLEMNLEKSLESYQQEPEEVPKLGHRLF